jgi:hypothetical protein
MHQLIAAANLTTALHQQRPTKLTIELCFLPNPNPSGELEDKEVAPEVWEETYIKICEIARNTQKKFGSCDSNIDDFFIQQFEEWFRLNNTALFPIIIELGSCCGEINWQLKDKYGEGVVELPKVYTGLEDASQARTTLYTPYTTTTRQSLLQ